MIKKLIVKFYHKILSIRANYQLRQFAEKGYKVTLGSNADLIPSHVHCGHHVYIGPHASFMASIAHIYIGNYVTFGPNVTIRGASYGCYRKTYIRNR